jgi:Flp pilus assembly protein TadD
MTKRHKKLPAVKPSGRSTRFGSFVVICFALILVNLVIYEQVRNHDFVNWDDDLYVTANRHVLEGLSWPGVRWAFTTGQDANWHPLTWIAHMADVQLFGVTPGSHHVMNVVLHIANTILLFVVLFEMTGALGRSAFVAGLFASHPLHVESVAWISERKDVLSTLFWMLTLWAYARFVREPRPGRYVVMATVFALGLMAKPMLVTLPVVLLLLDVWPLRRVRLESGQTQVWFQLVREKLPLLVLAIASSIVTIIVQQKSGAVAGLETVPFGLRLANAALSSVSYLGKMLWPAGLTPFYRYLLSISVWWIVAAVACLIGITVMVVRMGRQHPYLLVGWLWYLVTLAPVIGLIQVGGQRMADRYTYIPLIGIFIIVSWGIPALFGFAASRAALPSLVLPIVAGCVILACAITARVQVRYWKNGETLWRHAVAINNDDARAHGNLGLALAVQGRQAEAMTHYREALRLNPENSQYYLNIGNTLREGRNLSNAAAAYSAGIRINPNDASLHNALGVVLTEQERAGEAITQFKEAVRLNPDLAEAHNNMAIALGREGRADEAIREFQQSLQIDSENAQVHFNFAFELEKAGRTAEALRQYEAALRLDPQNTNFRRRFDALTGRIRRGEP